MAGGGAPGASAPLRRFVDSVEPLAACLARGGVLAIPTESSYGLAVDPRSRAGVEAIYRIKGRERGKALPVVAASVAQLALLGVAPDAPGLAWAAARWPAPLSLVVPVERPLPAAAGGRELAVRVPDLAPLRTLLERLGHPLTATSANPSGAAPYLTATAVAAWLGGREAIVVDGGALPGGAPSTLVRFGSAGLEVLRAGRYPIR